MRSMQRWTDPDDKRHQPRRQWFIRCKNDFLSLPNAPRCCLHLNCKKIQFEYKIRNFSACVCKLDKKWIQNWIYQRRGPFVVVHNCLKQISSWLPVIPLKQLIVNSLNMARSFHDILIKVQLDPSTFEAPRTSTLTAKLWFYPLDTAWCVSKPPDVLACLINFTINFTAFHYSSRDFSTVEKWDTAVQNFNFTPLRDNSELRSSRHIKQPGSLSSRLIYLCWARFALKCEIPLSSLIYKARSALHLITES